MTIPTLATLEQLRAHLKLPTPLAGSPPQPAPDSDLQLKLDAATQLVCDYIADRQPADSAWIAEIEGWSTGSPSAPAVVVLAVLEQAAELYRFRGDDPPPGVPARESNDLTPAVKNLLNRYRRPVFA